MKLLSGFAALAVLAASPAFAHHGWSGQEEKITALTGTGRLSSAAFHQGAASHDASDRIIYDPATGRVLYDADGTGAAAAVEVAKIGANLNLNYSDFFIT